MSVDGARRDRGAARSRLLATVLLLAACEREAVAPANVEGKLPPGVVAEVGPERIVTATVERVARAQGLAPRDARDAAISDALFAAFARETRGQASLAVSERSALSRVLLEQLRRQAVERGPATETELDTIAKERWTELDRPVTVRTTHALVRTKPGDDEPRARAIAEKLALALRGAASLQEFVERARAFSGAPFEVIVESLDPVTSDGRAFEPSKGPHGTPTGSYVEDYARAAHAIAAPGDHSPVTKTPYGFHVIRLDERLPEARVPLAERRAVLEAEATRRRAKKIVDELVEKAKAGTSIEVSRAAEELTSRVRVAP